MGRGDGLMPENIIQVNGAIDFLKNAVKGQLKEIDKFSADLAVDMEQWMKQNAIWQDITGAARASLTAKHEKKFLSNTIKLFYDRNKLVSHPDNIRRRDYSEALENMQSGRFGILFPASDEVIRRIEAFNHDRRK
jgi:hypothetical protein